jgi:AraC-like DNA-binding protein
MAVAVERLAEGEEDLGRLALATGFAHHSHFSARFRTVFGITPTEAREMLDKRRLKALSTVAAASRELSAG